jgi:lysophospholipase L1-like esterase
MTRARLRSLAASPVLRLFTAAALAAVLTAAMFLTGIIATGKTAQPTAGKASTAVLSGSNTAEPGDAGGHWVATWSGAPQLTEPGNMPPPPFTNGNLVFADSTLRQTIHVTVGGSHIRLRFSNAYGGADLPITMVSVALPLGGAAGVSAIAAGTSQPVTFDGRTSIDIPVGAQMVSDPLDFPVASGSNMTVTIYLSAGQASASITSHPGSRTTSYMLAGNHLTDADLPGAASVNHWYFLSNVEVWSPPTTAAVAVIGDSLTDGRGSTTNGNDRWTDQLFTRLQANRATDDVTVLNQGLGGNRVLNDGLGPNVLARVDRDVLAQSGAKWLIVFEGVNDIGTAAATEAAQKQVAADLIAAYQQIITRAHAAGIKVYGATITPFGGNTGYDDPTGFRAAARQTVNEWIRTSRQFDAVLDFDKAIRDPQNPRQINPLYDVGDHLHLNPAGYGVLASAVPAFLFLPAPFQAARAFQ